MNDEPDPHEPDVEVELVDAVSLPDVHAPETGSTDRGRHSGPLVVVGALLVALVGWIGFDAVLTDDGEETTAPTTTTPADPAPSTTIPPEPTTTTAAAVAAPAAPFPALRLLPDAPALDVPIAVIPFATTVDFSNREPDRNPSNVWFIDGERVLSRGDLPAIGPTTGGGTAFTDGSLVLVGDEELVAVNSSTGERTVISVAGISPRRPGFIAAGSAPGEAWLAVRAASRASERSSGPPPLDVIRLWPGREEILGERYPVPDASPSPAAAADGLITYPNDDAPIMYWSPAGGAAPIEGLGDGPWIPGAARGDLAAFWSPGQPDRPILVIDVRADQVVAELTEPPGTRGDLVGGCFAPDQRRLAVRHVDQATIDAASDGDVFVLTFEARISVLDIARPDEPATEVEFDAQVTGMTWISPTALVAATPDELLVVDVTTGVQTMVAELAGAEAWLVDADGLGC
ncbi:MAG: hypothetical protein S0880_16130 [Actinomycetota bacterium]|nr:hypothetical protein [Actinomycetota bacterium]